MENGKNGLVLSGGSIKGAFQAGAIYAALKNGFIPEFIYGISVGALNGAFLTNAASKYTSSNINWPDIADELKNFWYANVKTPKDLIIKRSFLGIGISAIFKNFDGLSKTTPLDNLIDKTISVNNLKNSPVKFSCGVVQFESGLLEYFTNRENNQRLNIVEAVKASKAIPLAMQAVINNNTHNYDGGIRDINPLKPAIKDGCENILLISCHAKSIKAANNNSNFGNLSEFANRLMEIVTNETANNDIEIAVLVNKLLEITSANPGLLAADPILNAYLNNKSKIEMTVVQPNRGEDVAINIEEFTEAEIDRLFKLGESMYAATVNNFKTLANL